MARGEPAPRGARGPGLAIWASFGVVCLGALLLVVWTTRACDGGSWWGAPTVVTAPEAFAGADAALVPLGSRGCLEQGGPTVTGAVVATTVRIEDALGRRGYVPAADAWSAPVALPYRAEAPGVEGSCGVIALAAEAGAWVSGYRAADGRHRAPCLTEAALVPVCEGDTVSVDGTGTARVRAFLMPGLGPEAVAASGMPAGVVLAHAEAEAHLRAMGWEPADEVVRVDVRAGSAGSHRPPAAPASGCIGWVAVSEDLGQGTTWWAHRQVSYDRATGELTAGLVACAPDPSLAASETRLDVVDSAGAGGSLWYRPYAPSAGPAVPVGERGRAISAASMRAVAAPPTTLPRAVPMAEPSAP